MGEDIRRTSGRTAASDVKLEARGVELQFTIISNNSPPLTPYGYSSEGTHLRSRVAVSRVKSQKLVANNIVSGSKTLWNGERVRLADDHVIGSPGLAVAAETLMGDLEPDGILAWVVVLAAAGAASHVGNGGSAVLCNKLFISACRLFMLKG